MRPVRDLPRPRPQPHPMTAGPRAERHSHAFGTRARTPSRPATPWVAPPGNGVGRPGGADQRHTTKNTGPHRSHLAALHGWRSAWAPRGCAGGG